MKRSNDSTSRQLYERARLRIPGGVNSPVRAFRAVGGNPPFIRSASGCRIEDADGWQYIDYVGSWGPLILGHAHPEVVEAIRQAAQRGASYGAPTEAEVELAEKICHFFSSIQKVRLMSSGTEATMTAIRLARAYTERPLIIKFDGCYHGHSDSLLVQAGSGVLTLGLAGSPGIPESFAQQTLSLPFGNLARVNEAFRQYPEQIAAVILEPVPANMGVIPPQPGFLKGLIEISRKYGAVAIFDEVITGFRLAPGGAQQHFDVAADLTCLGKILGGGLPMGACGGRREIMDLLAPEGPVYQAGTLSGNPIAVSAGLKTLEILERENPYPELERKTVRLCQELQDQAGRQEIDLQVQQIASLFTGFFSQSPVGNYQQAQQCDTGLFGAFFQNLLENGIYIAPSQFEAGFVSTAHTDADIEETITKAGQALQLLKESLLSD